MSHLREDVTVPSGGDELAAWVYRPTAAAAGERVPCVVMAHGFSATRRDGLEPYAERFAEAGLGVVLFDYRGFGDSGGAVRQVVDVRGQQEDFANAVRFAARLPWVDPARIALFGSSFSGGHVVQVAARDHQIAAAIAQAPFADGLAQLRNVAPRTALRGTLDGLADLIGAAFGRPPRTLPAVAAPGGYAVMTAAEAEPGFRAIVGAQSRWRNAVAARIMLQVGSFRPVRSAPQVACPLLVCVCDLDATTPPGAAVRLAELAPRGALVRYPIGHFDIYTGMDFERAVGDQVAFLQRVLQPSGAPVGA